MDEDAFQKAVDYSRQYWQVTLLVSTSSSCSCGTRGCVSHVTPSSTVWSEINSRLQSLKMLQQRQAQCRRRRPDVTTSMDVCEVTVRIPSYSLSQLFLSVRHIYVCCVCVPLTVMRRIWAGVCSHCKRPGGRRSTIF